MEGRYWIEINEAHPNDIDGHMAPTRKTDTVKVNHSWMSLRNPRELVKVITRPTEKRVTQLALILGARITLICLRNHNGSKYPENMMSNESNLHYFCRVHTFELCLQSVPISWLYPFRPIDFFWARVSKLVYMRPG